MSLKDELKAADSTFTAAQKARQEQSDKSHREAEENQNKFLAMMNSILVPTFETIKEDLVSLKYVVEFAEHKDAHPNSNERKWLFTAAKLGVTLTITIISKLLHREIEVTANIMPQPLVLRLKGTNWTGAQIEDFFSKMFKVKFR